MPTQEKTVRDAESFTPSRGDVVVTLVHGTVLLARWPFLSRALGRVRKLFSRAKRGPLWHERGSEFTERLTNALDRRCHIEPFDWSGGNTVWDRLAAAGSSSKPAGGATTLREHIADIEGKYSGAAHVLVGHSHGGSVCLAALRDADTRNRVKAFVSLSTPYVHVRQRRDAEALQNALWLLAVVFYLAFLFTIPSWLEARIGEAWAWIVFSVVFVLAVGLGTLWWERRKARNQAVREWSQSINEPADDGPARLVVTSDGDEALLALKVAEALSALSRALWRAAYSIIELLERAAKALRSKFWLIYLVASVGVQVFLLLSDVESPWGPRQGVELSLWWLAKSVLASSLTPGFIFVLLVLALFVPTLGAMLVGFPFLVFFRWLAFGWGGSPGVDVTAESVPLGTATAVRLPAPANSRGLRHSELYNDARVPPLIAEFILRSVANAALR